jgi:hypothetical protein
VGASVLVALLAAAPGCAVDAGSGAGTSSGAESLTRTEGDRVYHVERLGLRTLHAEIFSLDGKLLFDATYQPADGAEVLSWTLPQHGGEVGSAKGQPDPSVETLALQDFYPAAGFIYDQQLSRLANTNYDNKGCDAFLSSSGSKGRCCDFHDDCFSDHNCTSWSWASNILLGPLLASLSACGRCNNDVAACAAGSSPGPSSCVTCGDCGQPWPWTHSNGNTYSNDIASTRGRGQIKCDGTPVDGATCCPVGGWDGAHCYMGAVPSGSAGGFVYDSQLYYQPLVDAGNCPQAGSWWDGAHCHLPNIPAGTTPFIYNGNPYYSYAAGSVRCPIAGSWDDGANCYVSRPQLAPAFVYAGQLYYWMPSCPVAGSWYDGANCKMPNIPVNRGPFIWSNGMYYSCQ